ncbi:A-kinase anchor protein 9 isoform X3 [Heterodontus francisci]|uniref:A-kinase anchor protein 9 isoform X3 n=1 Tax=Heterodontus francisci TaxID=7792 RepID=UPI00355C6DE4
MEDEERQKKLEAGKARLAQFRQRKAQTDLQNPGKKQKKKKKVASKMEEQMQHVSAKHQPQGVKTSAERGPAGDGAEFIINRILHSGNIIKQDQTYTVEPESEVSTTADDYTSEANGFCTVQQETVFKAEDVLREEEFSISGTYSEHDAKPFQTRLEIMEEGLAAKQQEVEELNRELEELRGVFGKEGFRQLQEFEAAVKQRDGIITQLTANLQQARKEKDEILQEFLDLTEQSQKLQIQFQQLQASEAVRSTSHGTTAADLMHSKQQLITYQMQIDEQEQQLKTFQKMNDECHQQIKYLQAQLQDHAVTDNEKKDNALKLDSKNQIIEQLEKTVKENENATLLLKDKLLISDKLVQDLNEQILQKNQETENLRTELTSSKQRERQSSDEIKQLMGTVEALQKRCHMGNLSELETVQRIEIENHRKMEQLQAELDEMYGKQIVQMKQELQQQHTLEIRRLTEQHKTEMEKALGHSVNNLVNEEQINLLNVAINELNAKLRDSHFQRDQIRQEMAQQLERASEKNIQLQNQAQELLEELSFTKGQIRRASESITDQKYKMYEVEELKDMVDQLKAQLKATSESNKELESEHEAEVTNYKIKLDMLEREKDEVLDRMAESQEAELERVRTQLLFSHEEELRKLKNDLESQHKLNVCNLQEAMALKQCQQLESLQTKFSKKLDEMKCERDNMVIKNNQLLSEMSLLKEELQLSLKNAKVEEMYLRISELETEIKALREVEKEKSTLEMGILELQVRNKVLEKQFKEQEAMEVKVSRLQKDNEDLEEIKKQLEEKLKIHFVSEENKLASVSENELSEMRGHIERLTVVNGQLETHERELQEEVERQRNTFSFAEKNFEVNFQELRDEYDCLLKMKSHIEEMMIKQKIEYEAKLKTLNEQLQLSELKKDAENCTMINEVQLDKTLDNSNGQPVIIESREVIEKDATELMEKLEIAQQDKNDLSKRLSDLSEVLILRQNEILHLKEELKFVKEQGTERCEKMDRIESHKLPDVEVETQEHQRMSPMNLIEAKNEYQSNEQPFTVSCELKEQEQQKENLMKQIIPLQNSMKINVLERDEIQQNQNNLSQEKESLLTQIQHLREELVSESLINLQTERDHLGHQLESVQTEQLGLTQFVQQKTSLEETFYKKREEMENIIIAPQEKLELEKKIEAQIGVSICDLHIGLEENLPIDADHKGCENSIAVQGYTESDQGYLAQLEITKQQAEAELKLQLEAQRISLTHIYAAQLELVRDSLKNEKETALERLRENLIASHTLEIKQFQALSQQQLQDFKASPKDFEESSQTLMEKLNKKISDECMQLSQSFAGLLGEDYLIERRENEDQSKEVLALGNTDSDEESQVQKDLAEEARVMQANLQILQRKLLEEYSQLRVLQTQLTNDFKKIEDLQAAYINLQLQSEEENASLRLQIESSRANSQDFNDLKEQLRDRSARLEEIEKRKLEFCQQKAELEDQHVEEIKCLKTTYKQQCKVMEEKYTAEIICLQQRLQKVTRLLPQCRPEINAPDEAAESCAIDVQQQKEGEHKVEAKVDSTQEQQWHMKHLGLSQQLQSLREPLHAKYKDEISDLKDPHNEKLEQVETVIRTHYNQEVEIFGEESTKFAGGEPTSRVLKEVLQKHVFQETHEPKSESTHVIYLLKKQYEERLQEEIAKVIVQMSVQFAQQTEMARMMRELQAHPTPCKRSDEEWENEMEQRLGILKQDLQFQFDADRKNLENLFSEEKEELQRALKQKNAEILAIQRQLQNYKIEYKLETHGVDTDAALQEFLKANQELFKDSYAKDNSILKEMSVECKIEPIELERQDVAQERLEEMRQELVRQDQEHQQSVEALRQFHVQQLERLHEEQEQLLAEVDKLKGQLAEHGPVCNEKLALENQRMFAELEKHKCLHATEKESLSQRMHNRSTQTELSEAEDHHKSQEHSGDPKSILSNEKNSEEGIESALTKQRNSLQKTNERLLKVLSEVVKTTAAAEETISRHVSAFLERSIKGQPSMRTSLWEQDARESIEPLQPFTFQSHGVVKEEQSDFYHDSDRGGDDTSIWSGGTDEGLELSHSFTQSISSGEELDPETEELVLNVGTRLQAALEKLLEAITETTYQLDHARVTQTELKRKSVKNKGEIADLRKRQEELLERINEELKAREQLALELHKAEGIIDGYTEEKAGLERQIREKAEIQHQIAQELQHTSSRLHELEEERQQLQQERELITRQQVAMKENAGSVELRLVEAADAAPEAELLAETEKLMKEKREVQRQAEKEQNDFAKQAKMLESELEEQVNTMIEMEQEKNAEILDLQQQIVALEKQLEKNRKFLDEQAIDREQERDVFQQEILKLEQQLKTPQRLQPNNDQRNREMENLTDQLKDKTDRYSELLLAKEQLQRDVQERNEEIEKMENRVRELEQALISTTYPLQKAEERKLQFATDVRGDSVLETQLQVERDALERKEKEIANLEEQLEQFREELLNKNEEVQQLHMQLEIQRKEAATQLQEIQQENKLLENEVDSLQTSMLDSSGSSRNHHSSVGNLSQTLKQRDQEIEKLNEQNVKLQQQLEITSDNKVTRKKNEQIRELEAQIECLKSDQERLKKHNEEEVEQLNEVIEKLQQELTKVMPLELVPSEDAENLKLQLDMMIAEKKLLQQQIEKRHAELILTQQKLEEQNRMLQTQGLELIKTQVENKDVFPEDAQYPISGVEFRMQELQAAIEKKERELNSCHLQIQNLKEQAETEVRVHENQILTLEEALRKKVATVLVSQAQLKAVQQQIRICLEQQSSQIKERENASGKKEKKPLEHLQEGEKTQICPAGSKDTDQIILGKQEMTNIEHQTKELTMLREQLTEVQQQLLDLQKELEFERQVLSTTQKEATEKEEKLIELHRMLERKKESTEVQVSGIQISKSLIADEKKVACLETPVQQGATSVTDLVSELEQVKAEAAVTKEQLNSYRDQTEKLQEDLQVKELTIIELQEKLNTAKQAFREVQEKVVHLEQNEQTPQKCITEEPKHTLTKERPIKILVDSAVQTEILIADIIQATLTTCKYAGKQTSFQPSCINSSEEVTKIRRQCSEKLNQLQELHAVEIAKLEARYSAETEALIRNHKTQMNALREEYDAVKAVINSSRLAHLGRPEPSATLQLGDRDVIGGSSVGSPGTFDITTEGQEYRTMPEGTRRVNNMSHTVHATLKQGTENLPDKIKSLLHEVHQEGMQVLTLSESPYLEGQQQPLENHPDGWLQERWELLNIVQSLKDVLAKVQGTGEAKTLSPENITDWRRELLQAVQHVFNKERDVFMLAIHAQASSLNRMDTMTLLNMLKEQETQRRADMEHLMTADRNSMMMEIRELWSYLHRAQQGDRKPMIVEEPSAQRNEVELLGNNLQQKQAQVLELQMELNILKEKGAALQDHLNSEKVQVAELKNELSQTKLELETTLKAQHKHFKELEMLRVELTDKAAEVDMLNDALANEQKKARELQWALEKEKCKIDRKEAQDHEELEDLKFALEDHKKRHLQLKCALEKERVTVNELRQNLDSEKALHEAELSHEKSRYTELQIVLNAEKTRSYELNSALERERQLLKQLQSVEEMQKPSGMTSDMLVGELQRQLEDQHNRIVELVSEMERYKLESVQLRQHLEEQQEIHRKSLLKEQESHRLILEKVDSLQLQAKELLHQLEKEKHEVLKLQREEAKLKETLLALQETDQVRREREAENQLDRDVAVTEKVPQTENACKIGLSTDRTRNWIIQQKLAATDTGKSASISSKQWYTQSVNGAEIDGGGTASGENINLENIRQKMQLIISKISMMEIEATTSRMQHSTETTDDEGLIWLQNNIQDVALQLQQLYTPVLPEQNVKIPSSGSTGTLTERLLKQNADLSGFVSRLAEEKNDLNNCVLKLEEEVRKYRQRSSSSNQLSRRPLDNQDSVDALIKSERIVWAKEKSNLQKALKLAEAELAKMKAEARSETLHTELLGSISETVAIKRIYWKYLRAESFRKALIYQKKYLLLLLGGFQECEQATLSFIARMGGHPSYTNLQIITHRSRGFTRFRSVVRVAIAISRLRFLVRRWLRAPGSSSLSVNRNGHGQVLANEPRVDSPLLNPGSMSSEPSLMRELFGDRRHCTSRQRSGQESPSSATNSQPRYQSSLLDSNPGSLASSHLQSYDPDRALTDYISRLESLQRRLGSVQSGESGAQPEATGTTRRGKACLHAPCPMEKTVLAFIRTTIAEAMGSNGAETIQDDGILTHSPPSHIPLPPHPTISPHLQTTNGVSMHLLLPPPHHNLTVVPFAFQILKKCHLVRW